MKEIRLLQAGGTGLLVGAFDGRNVKPLQDVGVHVTAVDPKVSKDLQGSKPDLLFEGTVQDFLKTNNCKYNVIVCNNVLHLMSDEAELWQVIDLLWQRCSGSFWFTVFGPHDAWADCVTTTTRDKIDGWLIGKRVHHVGEEISESLTYGGEIKKFHIISVLLSK